MNSCAEGIYHYIQVFNVKPIDETSIKKHNEGLLFEDDNCAIFYEFWSNGGDASFEFYNKTNDILYIDLTKSFFIKDGIAKDYYN